MYRPDAQALALLQQDVLDPWVANRTLMLSGRLPVAGAARTFRVATPLDGTLTARVTRGARVAVFAGSRRLARGGDVETIVCGARTTTFRVTPFGSGTGRFTLTLSLP
jgi:hypothetical protein